MKKYYILLLVVAGFALAVSVSASVTSGTLSTGLSSGPQGVVIVPPTASPLPGTYTSAQDVVLLASGSSSINYTFDDSIPDCSPAGSSLTYSVPIPVDVSRTIKALSCYADNNHSDVASFAYVINIPATPTPPAAPSGGGGGGGGGGGTPPAPIVIGDVNKDGAVNKYDFALMMANWGTTGSSNSSDLNNDGKVDKYDFAILMAHWSAT